MDRAVELARPNLEGGQKGACPRQQQGGSNSNSSPLLVSLGLLQALQSGPSMIAEEAVALVSSESVSNSAHPAVALPRHIHPNGAGGGVSWNATS